MTRAPTDDILERFELCEQFATYLELPVDYVWSEFADPHVLTLSEILNIFLQY